MSVISELVRAIPMAIQANRAEKTARSGSVKGLKAKLSHENSQANNKHLKSDQRDHHKRIADKLRSQIDDEDSAIKNLDDDEKTLIGARVDAGFDYRENSIARDALNEEYNAADPTKAAADAKAQTDSALAQTNADAASAAATGGDAGGGAAGGADTSADASAQITQLQGQLAAAAASGKANLAALTTFAGAGDIGTGGFANALQAAAGGTFSRIMPTIDTAVSGAAAAVISSGAAASSIGNAAAFSGGNAAMGSANGAQAVDLGGSASPVTLNINTLHPGDPRTLDAIGRAATAGFRQQNPVASPRIAVGL